MINVLITSFGSNTSIGVAKCLKDDGCFIIGTDSNPFMNAMVSSLRIL